MTTWHPCPPKPTRLAPPRTLAEARQRVGLTVRALAEQAKVSATTIMAYERGERASPPEQGILTEFVRLLQIDEAIYRRLLAGSRDECERRSQRTPDEKALIDLLEQSGGDHAGFCRELPRLRSIATPTDSEREAREASAPRTPASDQEIALRLAGESDPRTTFEEVRLHHERALLGHARRRQRERGISQAEAAERCQLSLKAYRDIELGRVSPRDDTIKRLALAFSVDEAGMRRHCAFHVLLHTRGEVESCKERILRSRRRSRVGSEGDDRS